MGEVATVASGRQHWQLRGSFEMLGMQEEQKGNRKFEIFMSGWADGNDSRCSFQGCGN
jgi:hypothetical protein